MGTYEKTHPWIRFEVDLTRAEPEIWLGLGEIQSKCQHLSGVPMKPADADRLHHLYLAKGIMATTAIEGNTLSEEEVERRIKGQLELPATKEYLGTEVDNVLKAANRVLREVMAGKNSELSVEELKRFNKEILDGLVVDQDVTPGETRRHSVTVGRYLGPPASDCDYLLSRMCEWLNNATFKAPAGKEIVYGVIQAIVAHLYLAWIHPFGDGNGRTARLLEVRSLLLAGAPSSAAHLLSNHYNQTRTEYYRKLDEASRNGGNILPFIKYAVLGLCDQLRDQLKMVREYSFSSTWQNFVHESFSGLKSDSDHRRRDLLLAVSKRREPVPYNHLRGLTPELAQKYAGKTQKTLNRDLNALADMKLITRTSRHVVPNYSQISGFMPQKVGPLPDELLPAAADKAA